MHIFNLIQKGRWVVYITLLALCLAVFILGYLLLQDTDGAFSLPRDEAFRQLSIAKTLAFDHIWGVGHYNFEAASPSLLYPLLLAVSVFIFGVHVVITSMINLVIAIFLLIAMQSWLARRGIKPVAQLFILLGVILLTPLPLIILFGMERTLLLLFAFLFMSRVTDEWSKGEFFRRTFIYAALMVATRYDGVLLIAATCIPLIFQRKWPLAFELALCGLSPMVVFGFIALSKGSYFLPNVWMVESAGSQFSYEWLLGCGVAMTLPLLSPYLHQSRRRHMQWIAGLGGVLSILLLTRNVYAFRETDRSNIGVYQQEYLVGRFVHRYYHSPSIISNDVGALSYLGDGNYLDLSGLASIKIARGKSDNLLNPGLIRLLSMQQSARLAIVSNGYENMLPEEWIRIASWEIPANDFLPKKVFSFYTLDTVDAGRLKKHLEEYNHFLPKDLIVNYFYTPPIHH